MCVDLCICLFIPRCVCTRHGDGAAGVFSCRLIMASLQCSAFHARIMNLCLLMLSGYEGYTGISLCIDLHFNVCWLGLILSVEKYYTEVMWFITQTDTFRPFFDEKFWSWLHNVSVSSIYFGVFSCFAQFWCQHIIIYWLEHNHADRLVVCSQTKSHFLHQISHC